MDTENEGLYILLISVHGLIRGDNLELGRDADTGGQTKYVVELARALCKVDQVARVDLLTRLVEDPDVDPGYAQPVEELCDKTRIIRLRAGPNEYLRKELLWDHLDSLVDNTLDYLHEQNSPPHIIHAHYADAGYVGAKLASLLGCPFVFTGHSLGRIKRRRMLAKGHKMPDLEKSYHISRRISAEEEALAMADLVVASSHNEVEEQYKMYDYYKPEAMRIIPPGTDLERFHPPIANEWQSPIWQSTKRFLDQPEKPFILALSRPDERKNLPILLKTYGESKALQDAANLVIVAGNREDINEMEEGPQKVMTRLLLQIDRYDLYGKVAYPKHHDADDIPVLYCLAANSRGVFINPALTEPFGLTIIEAAASHLPVVATEDGGPQDIIDRCHNGILVDPLDRGDILDALLKILNDPDRWHRYASNGVENVARHYSWKSHAKNYLRQIAPLCRKAKTVHRTPPKVTRELYYDRAIITELDQALLGDTAGLGQFVELLKEQRKSTAFAIATGRGLKSTLATIKANRLPMPDVLICAMGTEIYYAPNLSYDVAWQHHIDHRWNPKAIHRLLDPLPGLCLQPGSEQHPYKISYILDCERAPSHAEILQYLHKNDEAVNAFLYQRRLLDVLPVRASKGLALRYFCEQWEIALDRVLVGGSTAAEEDMMRGNTLGAVVSTQYQQEMDQLQNMEGIYFSEQSYAAGLLEAIEHYDFFHGRTIPRHQKETTDALS